MFLRFGCRRFDLSPFDPDEVTRRLGLHSAQDDVISRLTSYGS